MCRAKPLSSIPTIIGPPPRKMTRTNLELLGDLRGALACHQPPYRRELHLPVENPPFSCGHPAFLGTVFLVFVSHFWGALQNTRRMPAVLFSDHDKIVAEYAATHA